MNEGARALGRRGMRDRGGMIRKGTGDEWAVTSQIFRVGGARQPLSGDSCREKCKMRVYSDRDGNLRAEFNKKEGGLARRRGNNLGTQVDPRLWNRGGFCRIDKS